MPYTEIKKNSKGEWALFFTGWDTDVNGDGHRLGECKELIDSLAENVAKLASNQEYANTQLLFDEE